MATTLRTLPKFIGLTSSKFADLKTSSLLDSDALYFVLDAGSNGILYRGSNVFGESIRYVSAMPEAADALFGIVYFNQSNGIAYVKQNASTVVPIGVTTVSTISDSDPTQNGEVPNIGAVKDYVKAKVATVFTYKGVVATVADLPELEATSDETAVAGKTYYSKTGDAYAVLDLKVGDAVPAGSYEGPKVGDLYNVVTGEDGTSAEYAWTDKGEGVFEFEKLGSTIDYSIFMSKVTGASSGNIAVYGQGGQPEDPGITYTTGSTLASVDSAASTTMVNELAVANASSALDNKMVHKGEIDGTTDANEVMAVGGSGASVSAVATGRFVGGSTFTEVTSNAGVTLATEGGVSAYVTPISSTLNSKIDDLSVDAIHKGMIDGTTNASEIIVVGGTGSNVSGVATGKFLGGSTFTEVTSNAGVTVATEAGVSAFVNPISSQLDADKMDKVPKNSGGIVLISKDDGNSELTGYVTGSSAFGEVSGAVVGQSNVLATEEGVVTLINQMAWQDIE